MHSRVSGLSDYFARDEQDVHPHRPRRSWPSSTGASSGPAPIAAGRRAAATTRTELLGIVPADLRVPFDPRRGDRPRRRRLAKFDEYKPHLRHEPGDRLGVDPRLPGRHPRQRPRACCSWTRPRRRPSSSCWPTRPTRRWCSCRTPPGYMVGERLRAGRDHQGRRQDDQRGGQQHRAAPHRHHGASLRRRATTACAAAPTGRGSCSPGPTPRWRSWARSSWPG